MNRERDRERERERWTEIVKGGRGIRNVDNEEDMERKYESVKEKKINLQRDEKIKKVKNWIVSMYVSVIRMKY